MAFQLFRVLLPASFPNEGRRILIYGAGVAGEFLLREIYNNCELNYAPVGFLDDDPLKKGKVIHGLRVLGGNGSFLSICVQQRVEEVLIASSKFSDKRIKEITRDCELADINLNRINTFIK
jgi:FlaA1/EpsC-like NDP-sugar epimerase